MHVHVPVRWGEVEDLCDLFPEREQVFCRVCRDGELIPLGLDLELALLGHHRPPPAACLGPRRLERGVPRPLPHKLPVRDDPQRGQVRLVLLLCVWVGGWVGA